MPRFDEYERHELVDGIEECNPPLHPLFTLFAVSFLIWTIGYIIAYPAIGDGLLGWSQIKDYEKEVAIAEQMKPKKPAGGITLAAMLQDPSAIASGEKAYAQNCQACHGLKGPGPVGPDLSDNVWLYGGSPEAIEKVIADGTPKGMPGWKQLGDDQVRQIVAYVHSLSAK